MIAFISCVKKKQNKSCMAKDLYCSPLFRSAYAYAQKRADKIYILSAKYGLLKETDIIAPYNLTLNSMSESDKKK